MDSSCIIASEPQTTWSNYSTSSATSTDYESGEDESDTDMTDDYMDVNNMFNNTSNYYNNIKHHNSCNNSSSTSNDLHHTIDTCTNNYTTTISDYSSEDFNNSICANKNNNNNNNTNTTLVMRPTTQTRMHVAMAVISRAILPTVVSLYYALVRNHKTVVESLRRRLLPAIVAFLANSISRSLSSVQVFRPIRKESQEAILDNSTTQEILYQPQSQPEKSVKCEIIVDPPTNEKIRADVIFIHGLHGSLLKTWRQGTWDPDRSKLDANVKILRRASTGNQNIEGTSTGVSILSRKRSVMLPVNCSVCCPNKKATMEIKDTDEIDDTNKEHICTVRLSDISENNDKIEKNNKQVSKCWPQDWLPEDCPDVRVIAINYTTDPYLWRPVWIKKRNRTSMEDRSKEMMEQLMELGVGNRPIIWVAHSKGGLFVKQMIVNAWENRDSTHFVAQELSNQLKGFYQQTRGIMFYSVPHRGSSLADMNLPLLRQSIELTEIQKDCPGVLDLHRRFLQLCDTEEFNPEIFSFIETSLTLMSILYLRIVSVESADPGVGATCGVPIDHRDICKPVGRDCFLYQELAELINRVV